MEKTSKSHEIVLVLTVLVVLVGGIVGGVMLLRAHTGSGVGERCVDGVGCKPELRCVEGACRASCTSDADCTDGLVCASFDVTKDSLIHKSTIEDAFRACVPRRGPTLNLPPPTDMSKLQSGHVDGGAL